MAIVVIATLFSQTAQSADANVVLWPVVTEAMVSNTSGDNYSVAATVEMVPIKLSVSPNTRINKFIVLKIGQGGGPGVPWKTTQSIVPLAAYTYQSFSDYWLQTKGMTSIITESWNANGTGNYTGGCVGITLEYEQGTNTGPSSGNKWNGMLNLPNQSVKCTSMPRTAYRCTLTPNNILIDFGLINSLKLNGQIASTNFNMDCNGPVTVNFVSTQGSTLSLATGLTAEITLNNQNFGATLDLASGVTTHTLTAKLTASNVAAGDYGTSTVLILNYL